MNENDKQAEPKGFNDPYAEKVEREFIEWVKTLNFTSPKYEYILPHFRTYVEQLIGKAGQLDKQAQPVQPVEPVAFYGLGSQLYGMDGRPVKFSLGTQFYTHPPVEVVRELVEALNKAERELQACQAVLWNLERDGVDPAYGKGARAAIQNIKAALKSAKEHGL